MKDALSSYERIVQRDLDRIEREKTESEREARNRARIAIARAAIERAEEDLKHYSGPCSECRFSEWDRHTINLVCTNSAVQLAAFNQKNARYREWLLRCDEQRDERSNWGDVICGPDGILFEPMPNPPKPKGFFARLFS